MKVSVVLIAFFTLVAASIIFVADDADARRIGGGMSFGSRPNMTRPAPKPAVPQRQTPPGQAQSQAPRTGGMLGGLFGGLLAGTLIGSLLSGGGFNGGGFMDIVLIGLLAFVGYKLYKRFRSSQTQEPAPAGAPRGFNPGNTWNAFGSSSENAPPSAEPTVDTPPGFDAEEFLRGAKMAYTRLQEAWNNRDLSDIAQFATPAVTDVLKTQLAKDPTSGKTEIVLVNASLIGAEQEGNDLRAQVYFDVLMREDPARAVPETVREIWHFLREGQNGSWKLDGIQQVE